MNGAIFARGDYRALRWMALFGVVFALGVGQAAAQPTVAVEGGTLTTLAEGGALVPVTAVLTVPANTAAQTNFTVTLTIEEDMAALPQEKAEIGTAATADVAWEATTPSRGTSEYTFPADTFAWEESTGAQTIRKTVRMQSYRDVDAEDEKFIVSPSSPAAGGAKNFIVDDAQTQAYLLTLPFSDDNVIDEGATPALRLEADPPISGDVIFRVTLDSANDTNDYYLGGTSTQSISEQFTVDGETGDSVVDVPFTSVTNDVDRIDDTVTLVVLTTIATTTTTTVPIGTQVAEIELEVVDQHKLPSVAIDGITIVVDKKVTPVSPALTLVEGQLGTVTLVADRGTTTDGVNDGEAIKVALSLVDSSTAEDGQDYDLDGSPVSIGAAAAKGGSGTFTLDVDEKYEDIGEETLVLMATIEGDDANGTETREMMLDAITFTDATDPKIEPKGEDDGYAAVNKAREEGAGANGLWTPGETMILKAEDLFDWPETTTGVVLGNVLVADTEIVSASSTGDMVTITAREPGMTEVTVPATVTAEVSSFKGSQTVSNTASVTFPVTVDPYTITARSDMDVQAAADAAIAKAADEAASKQWEPNGATAMVALSELFDVPGEVTPTYQAESSDMGDVEAGISSDKMYVSLMPKSAGMATITVTAVDLEGSTVTSVEFDAIVMAPTAIVAKTQAEVDAVFMEAGAGMLMAGGDPVMVAMNELFTVAPGVEPTYSADSDMPAVIEASDSGMTATLTPLTSGDAMITVTAVDSASSSIVTVSSAVTVGSESLVVTLEMPDSVMNGNIVEGMSYDIKVMANRAVTEDTEVMILRDRAASYADDDDFEVSSAMIMTGESSATATLMVTEDMEPDAGHADGEMLVLYGMVNGASTNSLTFTIWDEAVPALPLFGQLLLALFLMLGGARLYRRRQD